MSLLDDLRTVALGAVLSDAPDDLLAYRDIHGPPGAICLVVLPRSYDDVSAILDLCNDRRVPVVPWGGGTNLSHALTPARSAVALDMKALDRVLSLDMERRTVTVQAGATPDAVDNALARHGLRFHHDPWSRRSATIGGSLALNSSGCLHRPYGRIGDQVTVMTVALADGTIVRVPAEASGGLPPLEPATFIGSEGILGVVLDATFRVHPLPETYVTAGFGFRDMAGLVRAIMELEDADLIPDSFIGGSIPRIVAERQPRAERAMIRALGIRCGLFVYYEGDREGTHGRRDAAARVLGRWGRRLPQRYPDEWWPTRHTYFEGNPGAVEEGLVAHVYDLEIPPERVMEMVDVVDDLAAREGLADRLSHALFTATDAYTVSLYLRPDEIGSDALARFRAALLDAALERGRIMRIHGYGTQFPADAVRRDLGPRLDRLIRLKRSLDPRGILNPGILIPAEDLEGVIPA